MEGNEKLLDDFVIAIDVVIKNLISEWSGVKQGIAICLRERCDTTDLAIWIEDDVKCQTPEPAERGPEVPFIFTTRSKGG